MLTVPSANSFTASVNSQPFHFIQKSITDPLPQPAKQLSWPKNTSVLKLCANALVLAEKPIRPKRLTTEDAESSTIRRV